jgi:hypothetical protein
MVFAYRGQDPFLIAIDEALEHYNNEAAGHGVTVIRRQKMQTIIRLCITSMKSPTATQQTVRDKIDEYLDDLMRLF